MGNGAYQFVDPAPKGREDDGFKVSLAWVRPACKI